MSRVGKCEWRPPKAPNAKSKPKPCGQPADVYTMGTWRCVLHLPAAHANCSHSLAPSGWCAFCGDRVASSDTMDNEREETS